MSVKNESKEQDQKYEPSPMKYILNMLFWVIFSIITIVLIMKFFEMYVNNNGMNSFFYMLIFLFSIGSFFIIYPKFKKMFEHDQNKNMERYLRNNKNNIIIGYLEEINIEEGFLDLDNEMSRKNIRTDKKFEKEDKNTWLEEEQKLFWV